MTDASGAGIFLFRPGLQPAFADTPGGMVSYASYHETDTGLFPTWWTKATMTGEEMFEELLNFRIVYLPE